MIVSKLRLFDFLLTAAVGFLFTFGVAGSARADAYNGCQLSMACTKTIVVGGVTVCTKWVPQSCPWFSSCGLSCSSHSCQHSSGTGQQCECGPGLLGSCVTCAYQDASGAWNTECVGWSCIPEHDCIWDEDLPPPGQGSNTGTATCACQ